MPHQVGSIAERVRPDDELVMLRPPALRDPSRVGQLVVTASSNPMENVLTGRSESWRISATTMLESIPAAKERAQRHVG